MDYNIKQVVVQDDRNGKVTDFFVNDVHVATMTERVELFCTVKNGKRSICRDKPMIAKRVRWNYSNLVNAPFKIDTTTLALTDLTWGVTGEKLTKKKLAKLIH